MATRGAETGAVRGGGLTGVRLVRHRLRRGLGLTALLAALALPTAASAQVGVSGCAGLFDLFFYLPPPNAARPIALDVFLGTDLNLAPPLPLATPGASLRGGPEARLSVGLGQSGYELLVGGGLLLPGPGTVGAARAYYGATANYGIGPVTFYVLATGGVWLTLDGKADEWGPGAAYEWRGAFGLRFQAGIAAVSLETGASTLGLLGEESGPIVGVRFGVSLGVPPPAPGPPV